MLVPPTRANDQGGVHLNSGVINKLCFLLTDGGTFTNQSITGVGMGRVANLFYEVNAHLLGATADYVDLSAALHQAASNLGWNPLEIDNLHRACLAVEIVNNWVDRSNVLAEPNGCRRGGVAHGGPFVTVAQGVAALQPNDTLNIAAGNYNERPTLIKPMTLRSYGGPAVIGQ